MSQHSSQAGWFGPPQWPLFGWLDPGVPGTGAVRTGVVFCSALGYEAICSHRTLRYAAGRAAASSFATLRFDYDGAGDSAGDDTDPDRLSAWLDSIDAAVELLRATAPVDRICLWGLRFGATLALLAGARRRDIDAIVAVAPVDGGRYLREQRALSLTGRNTERGEAQEAAGFILTGPTQRAIGEIALARLERAPARRILLLERDDLPADRRLAEHLNELHCTLSTEPFSGYTEMMLDAHDTVVPTTMIDRALEWLSSQAVGDVATSADPPPKPPFPAGSGLHSSVRLPGSSIGLPRDVEEQALWLGTDPPMFAIRSTNGVAPIPGDRRRKQVVLLLNAGSVHHVGPSRLYVSLARRLASHGMTVLRLDLPGIGDTPARPDTSDNIPYPPTALTDIAAAAAAVRAQQAPLQLHLAGLCSGAYHSLKAALMDEPPASIVVINPLTFHWLEGMRLDLPDFQVTAEATRYQRRALQLSAWAKLLRGKVDVVEIARVIVRRTYGVLIHALRDVGRRFRLSLKHDLASDLHEIAVRETQMSFVFAESDPGLSMLLEQAGRAVRSLARSGDLRIEIVPHGDHTFTASGPRTELLSLLQRHFDVFQRRQRR